MLLNDSSSWICSVCLTFYITFWKSDASYIFLVNILACKKCTCKNASAFVKMIQGIFLSFICQLYSEITYVLTGLLDLKPIVKVILLVCFLKYIPILLMVQNISMRKTCLVKWNQLTLSWRRPLSYRNQSIDLLCKSMNWFLYDNSLRHERVKVYVSY